MKWFDKILIEKTKEVEDKKRRFPLSMPDPGRILGNNAFRNAISGEGISLIAEIKRESPSAGLIRENFNPESIALAYQSDGADAVSVLTDRTFFGGSEDVFKSVRQAVRLPLLRKDFLVDEYQLIESHRLGADAVLLIVRILGLKTLKGFIQISKKLGMDSLVEAHSEYELEKAMDAGAEIIGINNRDLDTFQVDLQTSVRLIKHLPDRIVSVSESGVGSREDVLRLAEAGFRAVLVGESLMRAPDPGAALRRLKGDGHAAGPEPNVD